ncbi:male-specific lethal 1-like 1 [Osmerus mordax]|uniref:male-specific lethal 1-like 1 n=1 Tax=Osmerus mordax TaxID=8014 RepID=UPI0035102EE2
MTSSVFTNGGYKLDSGKADLAKPQTGTQTEPFPSLRREACDYVHSLPPPTVLGNIHNSGPHSHQGKAKVPSQGQVVACRPGQHTGVGEGQEENWGRIGIQSTTLRSMGGDSGSPVKSKTLLGHNNNMGKMDPAALTANKHPRDSLGGGIVAAVVGGPQASGLSQEGKRGGVRKGASHSPAQSSCIRQILLLQLELIEQQQLQLHNKSKEIDDLKAEKETLLARIERMERRLQLGRREGGAEHLAAQRAPRPPPAHTPPLREDQGSPPKTPEGHGGAGEGRGSTPRTLHFGRGGKGHKRRFLFQDPRSAKRRAQAKSALQKEALVPKQEPAERGEEEEEEEEESPGTSPDSPQFEELSYLSTTDMYLCCWHQPPPSPWREPSPKKEESVTIPSWRENIMDPLSEDEATDIPENLEDSVFLKRHSKHELDEKRRKRWDIQRIREQRMFQRLQQRMNRRKGIQESEPEVLSFYPDAEDVEALIITPHLPVVAFGRPLPKLTRRNFDLPWLDERSRCRVEVPKKQTPHRTCRK